MYLRFQPREIALTLLLTVLIFSTAQAQSEPEKKAEAYQNQQRAFNLSILRSDIKLIDDAPQRCFLQLQIIKFIFENKVSNYFDTANSVALECLDETVVNANQFSDTESDWYKSTILSLLRKYSPDVAAKVEKKYFTGSADTNLTDYLDLDRDPKGAVNRIVAKINRDGVSGDVIGIIGKLKDTAPDLKLRLLVAILSYYESNFDKALSDNYFAFLSWYFLESATPLDIRKRFHSLSVRMGEAAMSDPNNVMLSSHCIEVLRSALPDIRAVNPELYPKASAIFHALNSKKSKYQEESEEIFARIRESKDKLAQAISEAGSAQDKNLKNELWGLAAHYALDEKKFRLAADLEMKVDFGRMKTEFSKSFQSAQLFFLTENILDPCLKENDIESAEYIVNLINDDFEVKSKGIFKIAARLVELKNRDAAFDKLNEGLKTLEKTDTSMVKVWTLSSLAIPVALKIDKTRAFDIASDMVKIVNRFPTPGPDDKPGTEARKKYVETLTGASYNLRNTFRALGKEDMALADPISQGLQLREWRLTVRITLETERLYPLPLSDPARHD